MKKLLIATILLLSLSITLALAHDTGTPHDEPSNQTAGTILERTGSANDFSNVLPFQYIGEKQYGTAIVLTLMWAALIYGFYNLVILVAGKIIHHE